MRVEEKLARLIRIPTVAGTGPAEDPARLGAFLDGLRQAFPLVHEHLELDRIGEHGLLYTWRPQPEAPAAAPLVLMAHADVVPAAATGWRHPPFAGVIEDGAVHGRGALDDKGPLVVVFEAVEQLLAEGFRPTAPLLLSVGGDEETAGTGAEAIAAEIAARGQEPWLILDEGGAVVEAPLPFVAGQAAMIGLGEKGHLTVRLHSRSDAGHASTPAARSAAWRIARAITRLERRPFPARLNPATAALLQAFAATASGRNRLLLRALGAVPPLTARLFALLGGEAAALVRTTVAVTGLAAGTAANVLAAEAAATVNLRLAPGTSVADALRRLRRSIADRQVRLEVLAAAEPSRLAPAAGPAFELLRQAVAAGYPQAQVAPFLVLAATDARHFQRRWLPAYRFAPLAMSASQRATIHGVDERVTVDSLERGVRVHRELIRLALGRTAPTIAAE